MRASTGPPFLTLTDNVGLLVRNDAADTPAHCCDITGRAELTPQLTGSGEGVDLHTHILDDTRDAGISLEMEPDQARALAQQLRTKADEADAIRTRIENR